MIAWFAQLALAAAAAWLAYRAFQVRAAANRLAAECSDYIAYVSRAAMRGDAKSAWLANRRCEEKREAVLAAFRRFYAEVGQPYPDHFLTRDLPSLQDPGRWEEMEQLVAGLRDEHRKVKLPF